MSDEKRGWPKRPAVLFRTPQRQRPQIVPERSAPPASAGLFRIKPGVRRAKKELKKNTPSILQSLAPAIIAAQAPKKISPRRSMRIDSTMSIRGIHQRGAGRGFPTMFRPQVGAVGGQTDFQPKTSLWALFIAAMGTLIAANSAPMDKFVQAMQSEGPTAYAAAGGEKKPARPLFIPLFGPEAVESCSLRCASMHSSEEASCRSACEKLSLSEYARRIRLVDTSPKTDADLITESCAPNAVDMERAESLAAWTNEAKDSFRVLQALGATSQSGNFARARLSYSELSRVLGDLKYPPPNSLQEKQIGFTDRMLRTSCLWAHETLIELALVLVRQNNDDYSMRYYSELKQLLQRPLAQMEPALLKDGKLLLDTSRRS